MMGRVHYANGARRRGAQGGSSKLYEWWPELSTSLLRGIIVTERELGRTDRV
jgi:hypothetical protein